MVIIISSNLDKLILLKISMGKPCQLVMIFSRWVRLQKRVIKITIFWLPRIFCWRVGSISILRCIRLNLCLICLVCIRIIWQAVLLLGSICPRNSFSKMQQDLPLSNLIPRNLKGLDFQWIKFQGNSIQNKGICLSLGLIEN